MAQEDNLKLLQYSLLDNIYSNINGKYKYASRFVFDASLLIDNNIAKIVKNQFGIFDGEIAIECYFLKEISKILSANYEQVHNTLVMILSYGNDYSQCSKLLTNNARLSQLALTIKKSPSFALTKEIFEAKTTKENYEEYKKEYGLTIDNDKVYLDYLALISDNIYATVNDIRDKILTK